MIKINLPGILIAVMVAGFLATGCDRQSNEANQSMNSAMASDTSGTVSNTWQSAKEAGSNAWDAAKSTATNAWDGTKEAGSNVWQKTKEAFAPGMTTNGVSTNYFGYDYTMKDAFISEARTSLDNLDQNAADLSNRLASASDSTKAGLQQTLQDIKEKRADLDSKYDGIKNATQDNWNDAKAAFAKSDHDLKADLKAAWDSVTSKL
jgi:hypothetical protein